MHALRRPIPGWISHKLSYLPYLIALLVLGFIGWVAEETIKYPDDGIYSLTADGYIGALYADGPAIGKLQAGDIILQIENRTWGESIYFYPNLGKEVGDTVAIQIQRGDQVIPVYIPLSAPPLPRVIDRLVPILVALCFWLVSVGIQAYKPAGRGSTAFLWFIAIAMTLAAGAASTLGLQWASTVFNCLLWALGPLSVHFHMTFPEEFSGRRLGGLLPGLYLLGVAGCSALLILLPQGLIPTEWGNQYIQPGGRLFLMANLFLVVWILLDSYRHVKTPGARGKIRLVLLGCGLVLVTFVALTLLPDVLLQQPLVPYSFAFLVLIFLPLTYGYAIFRLKFIEIEKHINRGATYILVYSTMGGFYLVLYALVTRFLHPDMVSSALLNTVLVLLLGSMFFPLRGLIQRFVDRVF